MQPKDMAYIWDMLNAARDIVEFTKGMSFDDFSKYKVTRFAVERQLLVIGEASHHLSAEFTDAYPKVPWKRMVGLRNILAHEYGEILTERIWQVATVNIPHLLSALREFDPAPDGPLPHA